jgi:diphthamide biosynthesis protein 7
MNPCSIETLPEPLPVEDDNPHHQPPDYVWPVVMGCYQLDERIGRRRGQLDVFHIPVPNIAADMAPSLPLQFGKPTTVLSPYETSGILDGKWTPLSWHSNSSKPSTDTDTTRSPSEEEEEQQQQQLPQYLFATAHASGTIKVYTLRRTSGGTTAVHDDDETTTTPSQSSQPYFTLHLQTQSDQPEIPTNGIPPLCLSLNFATKCGATNDNNSISTSNIPIVSTYSNGRVAIHDILYVPQRNTFEIIERQSWEAHTMFTNPSEVWSADFGNSTTGSTAGSSSTVVISAGDEGKVKVWDIRATNRPMQVWSPFDAGATCIATHPRHDYLVACGSYDETICLYDLRYMVSTLSSSSTRKTFLCRSKPLGGGIWRIKWHPYMDDRMLVAAMHGGCAVLQVRHWQDQVVAVPTTAAAVTSTPLDSYGDHTYGHDGHPTILPSPSSLSSSQSQSPQPSVPSPPSCSFKVTKRFTEHQSMAYGADWLVCRHPTRNGIFEAAVSCSFYDRQCFVWDSTD